MPTLCQSVQVRIVEVEIDGVAATVDFTETGFGTPKFAMVMVGSSNPTARYEAAAMGSIGWWCANGQWSTGWNMETGVATSNAARRDSSTKCISLPDEAATGVDMEYTATAITDGIRLTKNTFSLPGSKFVQVMLWGGAGILKADVGNMNVNGGSSFTGISDGGAFTPNAAYFGSMGFGTLDTTTTYSRNTFGWALKNYNGISSGTIKQGCIAWGVDDGAATETCQSFFSDTKAAVEVTQSGNGITVSSFGSGSISYTETISGNNYVHFIAIEFDTTATGWMTDVSTGWKHDEAGTPVLEKTGELTADADNFMGACIAPTMVGTTKDADVTTGNFLLTWGINLYAPDGTHGGISQSVDAGQATMANGGQMNDHWYWRQPVVGASGNGRAWQGQWYAREQGGGIRYSVGYEVQTNYASIFSVICYGVGTRNLWDGNSDMVGMNRGTFTNTQIFKGSTLLYGDDSF